MSSNKAGGDKAPLNTVPYTILVKTGSIKNAGTDSNVKIILFGSKGKTEPIHLKDTKDKKNPFELGKLDEFEIQANDVGKINKINIGIDNKGLFPGWYVESVTVKKDKDTHVFNANKWLDEKEGEKKLNVDLTPEPPKAADKEKSTISSKGDDTVKYVIKVKTGSVRNAATDSSVFITAYGNKGKTDKIALNQSKSPGKLFEKSKIDEFHVRAKNIGQINKITIGHESDGTIKSWYLDNVVISINETNYKFVAKRWLDQIEGDGKTWIDIVEELENVIKKPDETKDSSAHESGNKSPTKNEKIADQSKELKDFRKVELGRLKTALKRESSKIVFPKRKEHTPFVFNDLGPYYETRQVEYLLDMPQNEVFIDHCNRVTATGIVYPWIAHRMEREVPVPHGSTTKSLRSNPNSASLNQLTRKSAPVNQLIRPNKNEIEGSTLTPRFPKVGLKKPKGMTGPFYVDDVEQIRRELRKNFGAESHARQAEDKTRTVNDFYRMKLDHFHPLSKGHMVQVYHAYLDNTLGSKKALRELLNEEEREAAKVANQQLDSNRKSKSAVNV